jgi:hypothetical protein
MFLELWKILKNTMMHFQNKYSSGTTNLGKIFGSKS